VVTQLRLRATWLALQERLSVVTRVMDENLGALELAHERSNIRVSNTSAMNFSFFAAMGLVLWFGGNEVIGGEMSIGTLASFLTFMTILQMPVRQLGLLVNSFARASTCGTRLFELLDRELAIRDAPRAHELAITEGRLCFEDVEFRYPGSSRPAISGINFEAERGETIGIIGPREAVSRRSRTSSRASTTCQPAGSPSMGRTSPR
jgi:ATP-binding cassette subfamily B multidrug efflux pump